MTGVGTVLGVGFVAARAISKSAELKLRPATKGICMVLKKFGPTGSMSESDSRSWGVPGQWNTVAIIAPLSKGTME